MRATTSATLSKDEGVVWAANRTPQMIPNFCPYLFVGNQHRGFSWWAESPNGWGWSRKTPNCELVRKGDSVVDRMLHMVLDSQSDYAVIPAMDLLELDDSARLNTPGTVGSPNWEWRLTDLGLLEARRLKLRRMLAHAKR
jgi:4-alpha-glucanotransferase